MTNTINSFQGNGLAPVINDRTASSSAREPSSATTGNSQSGSGGEVQITNTASQLAALGQKLNSLPAIDQNRVARVSQSLADGSYRISPDKIASGLLQSDHALAQIGMQES